MLLFNNLGCSINGQTYYIFLFRCNLSRIEYLLKAIYVYSQYYIDGGRFRSSFDLVLNKSILLTASFTHNITFRYQWLKVYKVKSLYFILKRRRDNPQDKYFNSTNGK